MHLDPKTLSRLSFPLVPEKALTSYLKRDAEAMELKMTMRKSTLEKKYNLKRSTSTKSEERCINSYKLTLFRNTLYFQS